jgi:hypothetical protein
MIRHFLIFFFLFIATTACAQTRTTITTEAQLQPESTARPLWSVSKYKVLPGFERYEQKASEMLFKPLELTESKIEFDGQNCFIKGLDTKVSMLDAYLEQSFGISSDYFDLVDQEVRVIRTSCQIPGFDEFIRLPGRRLMVITQGFCLFLEPVVTY